MSKLADQLLGLRRRQQVLYVLVFTLATIVVWVVISLLTSQKSTQISAELQTLAKPLTPTLNRDILEKIEQKRGFTEAELRSFPIYRVITDTEGNERVGQVGEAVPTPSPSPSPSLTPSPLPTEPIDDSGNPLPASNSGVR